MTLTAEDVYHHVQGVCFKTGPPGTVGAETEWLVVDPADPAAPVPIDRVRALVDPGDPLPHGSRVTFEPGGQLELSSAPQPGLGPLHTALAADLALAGERLAGAGLTVCGRGVDPLRPPLLQHTDPRYRCMSAYFGPAGLAMMCSTASVQVCVDIGADRADLLRRWRLAHALGPVLVAAFANSPLRAGRRTGLRSARQAIWAELDPGRTAAPVGDDPVEAWTRYVLDARLMLIRDPGGGWRPDPGLTFREWLATGEPGPDDLSYHLSTLFPPVRPRGWLELRMIDAVPDRYWPVPVAVATALLDDPAAADAAAAAVEPVAGRWQTAAIRALADPALAAAARRCFDAALAALPRLGAAGLVPLVEEYADRYVERGRCPADDLVAPMPARRTGGPAVPATPVPHDEHALKEMIAAELGESRDRSLGLTTEVLTGPDLVAQVSPLMSPLVWDLAHVGNYEELWLLRAAAGAEPIRPEIDGLYDAFEHPRAQRPALPLLPPDEARAYIATVRARVLDSLETVRFGADDPLTRGGFVYGMVVQHEHQHDETMLATHQLRKAAALLDPDPGDPPVAAPGRDEVLIDAGPFVMGCSDDPWAYDNERPGHVVDLPAYYIDTTPVTVAAYLAFMAAGGYDDERWWSPAGWEWRCSSGRRAPGFWFREGVQWLRRRFGRVEPVPPGEPVQHVCWYEADAYARWAGKRLPTEAEWEKAARWDPAAQRSRRYPWGDDPPDDTRANLGQRRLRPAPAGAYERGASAYGVRQLVGDVWEWTSSDFRGYPGFRSFPYKEYSEVFFGPDYKVLRGGSWATHPLAVRGTFRNWDYPIRRQIFAGFRCARDAA